MQSCPSPAKAGYCTILNFQSANPVHLFQRDFALETIFTITRNQHPAKSGVRVISFRIISDFRLFFPYPLQKIDANASRLKENELPRHQVSNHIDIYALRREKENKKPGKLLV